MILGTDPGTSGGRLVFQKRGPVPSTLRLRLKLCSREEQAQGAGGMADFCP